MLSRCGVLWLGGVDGTGGGSEVGVGGKTGWRYGRWRQRAHQSSACCKGDPKLGNLKGESLHWSFQKGLLLLFNHCRCSCNHAASELYLDPQSERKLDGELLPEVSEQTKHLLSYLPILKYSIPSDAWPELSSRVPEVHV